MSHWKNLKPGDLIDIVAPASGTTISALHQSVEFLKLRGYRVRVPENIYDPFLFHANKDEVRFELLKHALLAKDSKAIWCVRGGYGANRLMPWLTKLRKPQHCKAFIGISDVTSIHLFLNQKWKWPSLHASLLDRLGDGRLPVDLVEESFAVLEGKIDKITFPNLIPLNEAAKKVKKLSASVIGGNLMTVQSTLGTPYAIQSKGKFLFLEEIDERGYRIDRMLTHLGQSGKLQGVKAVLLGQFIGGKEPQSEESKVAQALERFAKDYPKLPVFAGLESGHDVRIRALPLGVGGQLVKAGGVFNLKLGTGAK